MSANNTQTSKALEKLSSGLRINRAGDDAAGLAISEKMRGQIRGLDQASRNAQDAVSLLNTAEGNLSETQSILQRMKELATQAANDTNVGVDRGEIQKEINQLTSEINRIGNTTEFNTQKLLNGGGEAKTINVNTVTNGQAAGLFAGSTTATGTNVEWDSGALATMATHTTGTFNFNGVTVKVADVDNAGAATSNTVDAANKTVTINNIKGGAATATAAEVATALVNALKAYKADTATTELADFDIALSTDKVVITGQQTTGYNSLKVTSTGDVKVGAANLNLAATTPGVGANTIPVAETTKSILGVKATKAALITGLDITAQNKGISGNNISLEFQNNGANQSLSVNVTGNKIVVQLATDATGAVTSSRDSVAALLNGNASSSSLVSAKVTAAGAATTVTSTSLAGGIDEARGEYSLTLSKAFEVIGSGIAIGGQAFKVVASGAQASLGQINASSSVSAQAAELAAAINANATLGARFDVTASSDGKLTFREKANQATGTALASGDFFKNTAVAGEENFKVSELVADGGKYTVGGVDIVVTTDANNAGLVNGTAVLKGSNTTDQAAKLASAIAANSTLKAKYTATSSGDSITLKQKTGQESMVDLTATSNVNGKSNFQVALQVGANSNQSMTVDINDMRSLAIKVSGTTASGTVTASNGIEASYVATKNVTNGTTNDSVEYALDVSSHEKATAAISVLSDAIESVSAERSKIGAYTNRLEHTVNNLTTSSENMTAAESRIRDVDMAKEMMNFQKNNILAQAAQAMLAQANQQPQGVLQLLR